MRYKNYFIIITIQYNTNHCSFEHRMLQIPHLSSFLLWGFLWASIPLHPVVLAPWFVVFTYFTYFTYLLVYLFTYFTYLFSIKIFHSRDLKILKINLNSKTKNSIQIESYKFMKQILSD